MTMDQDRLSKKRLFFGYICHIAAIIAFVSVVDGLVSTYRKPANDLNIVSGQSFKVTGNVYGKVQGVKDISVVSDSPDLVLAFEPELFSGFWLGFEMWRAELKAPAGIKPGRYTMKIVSAGLSDVKPEDKAKLESLLTYTVHVYGDEKTLRQNSLSLINRYTGILPWYPAGLFFLLALAAGGCIFILSGKIDDEMAKQGVAEIYRVSKNKDRLEVFFGLGRHHGLKSGERLGLFDTSGSFLKEIVVEEVGSQNSSVMVDILKIKPGFRVARLNHEPANLF